MSRATVVLPAGVGSRVTRPPWHMLAALGGVSLLVTVLLGGVAGMESESGRRACLLERERRCAIWGGAGGRARRLLLFPSLRPGPMAQWFGELSASLSVNMRP